MTEEEWLSATSVYDMLKALRARRSPWHWSPRKSRLFACACCRRVWHVLTQPDQRQAVEAAERAADKLIRPPELAAAHKAIRPIRLGMDIDPHRLRMSHHGSQPGWDFYAEFTAAGEMRCNPGAMAAALKTWGEPYNAANDARAVLHFRAGADAARDEQQAQCALLRDIVGPARPLPAVAPQWVTSDVVALARGAYDERAFDRLPILADALQDAGCDNAAILGHLRGSGPHARGCWALDLILGKE